MGRSECPHDNLALPPQGAQTAPWGPRCGSVIMGHPKEDAPGEEGGGAGFERSAEDVGEVDPAEDSNDRSVEEEGEGCVGEGEVAVGKLAQADAVAAVEQVADVPQDGDRGGLCVTAGGCRCVRRGGGGVGFFGGGGRAGGATKRGGAASTSGTPHAGA